MAADIRKSLHLYYNINGKRLCTTALPSSEHSCSRAKCVPCMRAVHVGTDKLENLAFDTVPDKRPHVRFLASTGGCALTDRSFSVTKIATTLFEAVIMRIEFFCACSAHALRCVGPGLRF